METTELVCTSMENPRSSDCPYQAMFTRKKMAVNFYSSSATSAVIGVGLVGMTGPAEGVGRTGAREGVGRTEMVKERLGRGVRDGRLVMC